MLKLLSSKIFHSTAIQNTYYRRDLPDALISFTSKTGRSLFRKSLDAGYAEIYFPLSGNFIMQSEPAFCGLGSLAMVLNALSVDPGKRWKGVWRWYADDMLECCAPLEKIKVEGMTFEQVASTARCNGLNVVAKRADHLEFEEFERDIKTVCESNEMHMVVSFSRPYLGQTGDGHFSPIGAYDPSTKSVLVLDTARFKYPSYFVDSRQLFNAMKPIDKVTNRSRGYLLLTKGNMKAISLSQISIPEKDWNNFKQFFQRIYESFPEPPTSLSDIIATLLPHLYEQSFFTKFIPQGKDLAAVDVADINNSINQELENLKFEASRHQLFHLISSIFESQKKPIDSEMLTKATLFFASLPADIISHSRIDCAHLFREYQTPASFVGLSLLREEVARLAFQWNSVANTHCNHKHD